MSVYNARDESRFGVSFDGDVIDESFQLQVEKSIGVIIHNLAIFGRSWVEKNAKRLACSYDLSLSEELDLEAVRDCSARTASVGIRREKTSHTTLPRSSTNSPQALICSKLA